MGHRLGWFTGFLSTGRGRSPGRWGPGVLLLDSGTAVWGSRGVSAHDLPPPSPYTPVRCHGAVTGTRIQCIRWKASAHSPQQQVKLDKDKLDLILSLRIHLIFPGTPVGFAGDRHTTKSQSISSAGKKSKFSAQLAQEACWASWDQSLCLSWDHRPPRTMSTDILTTNEAKDRDECRDGLLFQQGSQWMAYGSKFPLLPHQEIIHSQMAS